jgi:adenylate cyclase
LSFFGELKRRHVYRVGIVYVVVAWLVLQVADVLFNNLDLPGWAFNLVLVLLIICFPIIVMLAWAYDLTPRGLVRTDEAGAGEVPDEAAPDRAETPVEAASPTRASVAVLPFVNMSGDQENEYFSDGLAEELLNVLANIDELKVAARTSSFQYKGQSGHVAEIARDLGVASVLEGSVRQAGNRVRITAQLISAADGYHLWSQTYDRELDDIFAVQDDIAASVAEALKVRLLGDEADHLKVGGTRNTAAFQAYLQGVHYRNRGSDKETLLKAVEEFRRAIELDPEYAQAHAGLASAWEQLATNNFVSLDNLAARVSEPAARSIELAPGLADGYEVLSRLRLFYELDEAGAREAIDTAMKLNPGSASVQYVYAQTRSPCPRTISWGMSCTLRAATTRPSRCSGTCWNWTPISRAPATPWACAVSCRGKPRPRWNTSRRSRWTG